MASGRIDAVQVPYNPFYMLPVPQTRIERVLAERAAELGVEVRRGHELTGLSEHADAVTVEVVGRAIPAAREDRGRIAVLELEREQPGIARHLLTPLTPREREVATLVVDGLSDREIAQHMSLSHHTVTQYVKRIYRKFDVDSRVTLTRALLRPSAPARWG